MDELGKILADFDASAEKAGLTRAEALDEIGLAERRGPVHRHEAADAVGVTGGQPHRAANAGDPTTRVTP